MLDLTTWTKSHFVPKRIHQYEFMLWSKKVNRTVVKMVLHYKASKSPNSVLLHNHQNKSHPSVLGPAPIRRLRSDHVQSQSKTFHMLRFLDWGSSFLHEWSSLCSHFSALL